MRTKPSGRLRRFMLLCAAAFFAAAAFAQEGGRAQGAKPRVALVLSGGAAFGITHVGVLRVLEEAGIPIDMILGTSMGALVGGLYATGYSPTEMEEIFSTLDWNRIFAGPMGFPGSHYEKDIRRRYFLSLGFDRGGIRIPKGVLGGQGPLTLATAYALHKLEVRNFDELPVPYRAVAADIVSGERVVFDSGSIVDAMRASMSIPGVFAPYKIEGRLLVDGGIADNMPVELARSLGADIVIAVESGRDPKTDPSALDSSLGVASHSIQLLVEKNMVESRKRADLLIKPDLSGMSLADFSSASLLMQKGKDAAHAMIDDISSLARRIARERPLVAPEEQANRKAYGEPPLLASIRIEGGEPRDANAARKAFEPLLNTPLDRWKLAQIIDTLYATGRYAFVRFDLEPDAQAGRARGILKLEVAELPRGSILIGADACVVLSSMISTGASFTPGLLYRNIVGPDSTLFVETSIGSTMRLFSQLQAGKAWFSALPFIRLESEHRQVQHLDDMSSWYILRRMGGGLDLLARAGDDAEFRLGYVIEAVRESWIDRNAGANDPSAGYSRYAGLDLYFRYDDRSGSAFPGRGLHAMARLLWASPYLGGESDYVSLEGRMGGAIRLSRRVSLGLEGMLATDFSGIIPGAAGMPRERLFSVNGPGLFYCLAPGAERSMGNHVAALGLQLRVSVGHIVPILGLECFAIAGAWVGEVVAGDFDPENLPMPVWSAALGAGLKVRSDISIMLFVGYIDDGNPVDPKRAALSLLFGIDDIRRDRLR